MRAFIIMLCLWASNAVATPLQNSCKAYLAKANYAKAVDVVAKNMGYSTEALCSLPRLLDLFIDHRVFYNENNEPEPHIWVTLHYNEYSCQYFVREADTRVTRKNCYNTW